MTSRRALTLVAIVVWAAVAVTAAPRAFSRRHAVSVPVAAGLSSKEFPSGCSDFHFRFDSREAILQTEERIITKSEAPVLQVQAEQNGGLYVKGWDKDTYSLTLCKAAEAGPDAESVLSQVHLSFQNGLLQVSGPTSNEHWGAHIILHAPKASALDMQVQNGPMTVEHVDGQLKINAENGPVTVTDCTGELDLLAQNGPVTLRENSGKQKIRSENGPVTLDLSGDAWSGSGLEARATNGPVTLKVPSGYKSGVVLEADGNGPFQCRASVCSEGRKTWDEEHKRVEFGSGPAVVRVSTVNGPVSVR